MPNLLHNESLVFMHIEKTGGTTLHNILVEHFNKSEICPERFNKLKKYDFNKLSKYKFFSGHYDRANVEYIPQKNKIITMLREPKSRILSLYYFWKAHREEVIKKANLGGPRIAKELSLLSFLRCRKGSIPLHINNVQVRTMLGEVFIGPNDEYLVPQENALEKAMEYLDSLFAFGILERYKESIKYFCELIDIECPEIIPRARDHKKISEQKNLEPVEREEITPEINEELDRLTKLDSKLYDYAQKNLNAILIENARKSKLSQTITLIPQEEATKYLEKGNEFLNTAKLKNVIDNYHQALKLDQTLLEHINILFRSYYDNLFQRRTANILKAVTSHQVKIESLEKKLDPGVCIVVFNNQDSTITYQLSADVLNFNKDFTNNNSIKSPNKIKNLQRLIETHAFLFLPFFKSFPDAKGHIAFDWRDQGNMKEHNKSKFLCFCGQRNNFLASYIPDVQFLRYKGYSKFRKQVQEKWIEWRERKPYAFWRGSSTGCTLGKHNWQDNSRIKLCMLAQDLDNKLLLDAKITRIVQAKDQETKEKVKNSGIVGSYVENIDFINYKYLIDIDGNSNSWPGLFTKLLTGSCVLKVESSWKQWYYDRLKPWVNYIPIKNDLSDLLAVIEWCIENDHKAQQIGENGRKLALSMTMDKELAKANQTIINILQ